MNSFKKYASEIMLASFPVVGFAAAALTAKAIAYGGRTFIHVGPQSSLLFGVIGAVNSTASFILAALVLEDYFKTDKNFDKSTKGMMAAHLLVGIALIGLSTLAVKVHLIASGITLAGGVVLIATGCLGNILLLKAWSSK